MCGSSLSRRGRNTIGRVCRFANKKGIKLAVILLLPVLFFVRICTIYVSARMYETYE